MVGLTSTEQSTTLCLSCGNEISERLLDGEISMIRRIANRILLAPCVVLATAASLFADEAGPKPVAEKPYLTIFAASIDRLRIAYETVFDSAGRPDLAISLNERLKSYRDLAGIERTKPLGIMTTWDDVAPAEIVFVPTDEIDELLKTATFDVLGFHSVGDNHYEIARPDSPYHVIIKKDYAFFADRASSIRGIRVTPNLLTQGLRDRYDLVVNYDLRQVPQPTKTKYIAGIRHQIEPWLQPLDNEAEESANFRKVFGQLLLDIGERLVLDTRTLTFGGRLDPKTHHLSLEVIIESVPKSRLANSLNRLATHRSEFSSLIQPDVPAGLALNLPIGGLVDKIVGSKEGAAKNDSSLEAGLQFAGTNIGDLSLIAALSGPGAADLNDAIPRLIIKLEKSGHFIKVNENFDLHHGVTFHSLTPSGLPTAITQWTGSNVEIIVGQGKQTIWIGIGQPAPLLERLVEAINRVNEIPASRSTGSLVNARIQARTFPELVSSDLLAPDAETAREVFSQGDDGFSLTVEPISDGLKLRIDFEEGFIRLIGRNWVNQIEASKAQ